MSISVLLADDHPMFRKGLRNLIETESGMIVVGEAGDGDEVIEQARELTPNVVVMDISMPKLSGIEATRQILSNSPQTKVLALSINDGEQFVRSMLKAGASGYLLKDSPPEEVIEAIRKVMHNELYLSNTITGIILSDFLKTGMEVEPYTASQQTWPTELSEATLFTKLHRPPLDNIYVHRLHLLERLDQGRPRPLTLVSAPAGYGKTTLVNSWLETVDIPAAWVSLDEKDDDLRIFATYFVSAVQSLFSEACRKTQSLLKAVNLPPLGNLSTMLLAELDRIEQPFVVVLDDYHLLKEKDIHILVTQMLKRPPGFLHLVFIGRRDPPFPISAMRARAQVTEIRTRDLRFSPAEIELFFNQTLGMQIDAATVDVLEKKTEGWVTGLRLAALSMRQRTDIDPKLLEPQVDAQYVMEYLFTEVFSSQPPPISRYLLGSAILDRFCGPLCEAVCEPGAEPFTCEISGWDFIAWLKKENLFVVPLDSEKRWLRYHHLFRKLLLNQLRRRFGAEDIKALHRQASAWFADNGLVEEALQHALTAGETDTACRLVAKFSQQLMNDEQWVRLERCLSQLPREQIERDPALLVVEAWIQHVRQNLSGMVSCLKMVENFNATAAPATWGNVKYLQGHLDALQGFVHYMDAEGESALASCQRACRDIPRHHKRARLFADIFQLGAYQMTGNLESGLSIYQRSMMRYTKRDPVYHATYLGNLGLVYWIDADLISLQQTGESLMAAIEEHRQPAAVAYGLYFAGIIHYHRNELHHAKEKLARVVESYCTVSPMNFARSALALALTHQARGKPDRAMEISRSVVANSIETNNSDMLKVAQAFEAELALRQGRLAEADRWVERYQAKPFRPTYSLHMPQFTAVKILLAQDTADCRRRAADLIDELHDFLVSIHNRRFLIDALALQALIHDARGDHSVALEKLTAALDLAEPGGFLRPFLDLGSRMADLLKQLVKQNVAIGYIKRILDAFSEDEQLGLLPDSLHHGSSSLQRRNSAPNSEFRIPTSAFHTSQPLVDPLTNRELDVLELLAQRLQNKEIAEKLHISPETVKKHLNNIYGKLNVSERRQAVEKARYLGILKS